MKKLLEVFGVTELETAVLDKEHIDKYSHMEALTMNTKGGETIRLYYNSTDTRAFNITDVEGNQIFISLYTSVSPREVYGLGVLPGHSYSHCVIEELKTNTSVISSLIALEDGELSCEVDGAKFTLIQEGEDILCNADKDNPEFAAEKICKVLGNVEIAAKPNLGPRLKVELELVIDNCIVNFTNYDLVIPGLNVVTENEYNILDVENGVCVGAILDGGNPNQFIREISLVSEYKFNNIWVVNRTDDGFSLSKLDEETIEQCTGTFGRFNRDDHRRPFRDSDIPERHPLAHRR